MLLRVVGGCCAKIETGQTFSHVQTDATTPKIVCVYSYRSKFDGLIRTQSGLTSQEKVKCTFYQIRIVNAVFNLGPNPT